MLLLQNNERLESAVNEYDRVWILPMAMRRSFLEQQKQARTVTDVKKWQSQKKRIYGTIAEIKGDAIYIDFMEPLDIFTMHTKVQPQNEKYFLRFMVDRTTIALEHRALDILKEHKIVQFLFPSKNEQSRNDITRGSDAE